MINLTSKEKFLLEGEKYQQQLAIDKYNNYALQAHDNDLKEIFSNLAEIEQSHLDMIDDMIKGIVPSTNSHNLHPYYNSSNNNFFNVGSFTLKSFNNNYKYEDGDKIICFDALTTEELLHSTYSAYSLEFEKSKFNDAFKYIINEKSNNLKYINDYMINKGMYNNTILF